MVARDSTPAVAVTPTVVPEGNAVLPSLTGPGASVGTRASLPRVAPPPDQFAAAPGFRPVAPERPEQQIRQISVTSASGEDPSGLSGSVGPAYGSGGTHAPLPRATVGVVEIEPIRSALRSGGDLSVEQLLTIRHLARSGGTILIDLLESGIHERHRSVIATEIVSGLGGGDRGTSPGGEGLAAIVRERPRAAAVLLEHLPDPERGRFAVQYFRNDQHPMTPELARIILRDPVYFTETNEAIAILDAAIRANPAEALGIARRGNAQLDRWPASSDPDHLRFRRDLMETLESRARVASAIELLKPDPGELIDSGGFHCLLGTLQGAEQRMLAARVIAEYPDSAGVVLQSAPVFAGSLEGERVVIDAIRAASPDPADVRRFTEGFSPSVVANLVEIAEAERHLRTAILYQGLVCSPDADLSRVPDRVVARMAQSLLLNREHDPKLVADFIWSHRAQIARTTAANEIIPAAGALDPERFLAASAENPLVTDGILDQTAGGRYTRSLVLLSALEGLTATDPNAAFRAVRALAVSPDARITSGINMGALASEPILALHRHAARHSDAPPVRIDRLIESLPEAIRAQAVSGTFFGNPAAAFRPPEHGQLLRLTLGENSALAVLSAGALEDPAAAMRWVMSLPPSEQERFHPVVRAAAGSLAAGGVEGVPADIGALLPEKLPPFNVFGVSVRFDHPLTSTFVTEFERVRDLRKEVLPHADPASGAEQPAASMRDYLLDPAMRYLPLIRAEWIPDMNHADDSRAGSNDQLELRVLVARAIHARHGGTVAPTDVTRRLVEDTAARILANRTASGSSYAFRGTDVIVMSATDPLSLRGSDPLTALSLPRVERVLGGQPDEFQNANALDWITRQGGRVFNYSPRPSMLSASEQVAALEAIMRLPAHEGRDLRIWIDGHGSPGASHFVPGGRTAYERLRASGGAIGNDAVARAITARLAHVPDRDVGVFVMTCYSGSNASEIGERVLSRVTAANEELRKTGGTAIDPSRFVFAVGLGEHHMLTSSTFDHVSGNEFIEAVESAEIPGALRLRDVYGVEPRNSNISIFTPVTTPSGPIFEQLGMIERSETATTVAA